VRHASAAQQRDGALARRVGRHVGGAIGDELGQRVRLRLDRRIALSVSAVIC
jgi:hypothetical protein